MVKRIEKLTTTKEKRVTGAQNMETVDLIKIWSKIESVRLKEEDSIAFMYDGKAYLCNHRRPANAHLVGDRVAKWNDFRKAQLEIEAELNERGVSIRVDEPKRKKHGTI